jgi:hypothetical protein
MELHKWETLRQGGIPHEKKNALKKTPKEVLEQSPTGYGFMSVTEQEGDPENQDENESLFGMDQKESLQSVNFSATDNPYFSDQEGV